jgi:hypothetical protein
VKKLFLLLLIYSSLLPVKPELIFQKHVRLQVGDLAGSGHIHGMRGDNQQAQLRDRAERELPRTDWMHKVGGVDIG